jgi:hypothetical protein
MGNTVGVGLDWSTTRRILSRARRELTGPLSRARVRARRAQIQAHTRVNVPTKGELESLGPTELAALCQRVADNPPLYSTGAANEAFELKLEWVSLQMPPDSDYMKEKQIEERRTSLKQRMAQPFSAHYDSGS